MVQKKKKEIKYEYLKKNILKSGGLATHKYGDKQEETDKLLDKILANGGYENDKKLIHSKISVLQGDIRSYKDDSKTTFKDFIDLRD
ncbi:unnamed protein product [Didymodactylos carnosus]|uniref:Uncharacterized protein n=1 Tax=Didymodactylos carnosus TaxID=1234261 RepID=A0A814VB16_9BILA|nr:unnamed protein product [Didymodactylos carnosus]CAF1255660.1 unnamed protein product [Didymodactylos carnosus]CAF3950085.1 unnamed protein product [Didymodactylos carnosus]CAF4062732.1 unnamed protein product [Didymodactylos carnosus]